jgi:KipI family sensor histidine kinase inhibitor
VAIHFDPLRTDYATLTARIEAEVAAVRTLEPVEGEPVRLPVCYGGEFGPDLSAVATFANISEAEVVRRHTARTYRVFMLGFMPGFAYMGIVDESIAAPRLTVPRLRVPRGSVGIAGLQTGVYPCSTPGGWQVVGRTPVEPFDLNRAEPCLFKPGDAVNFYAIDEAEFRDRSR